ncbi:unnamed protein product [Medioppia subpectinata]|uniref:Protein kinase domain-containing protein n=1 Tax=Medioppia subpectinata TaxID=1979941 RepID=A0A7R9KDB5_9ACAR|nr:unnamed protein product [Medioppia subpectinata]CAG2101405.1 unnamed protein product [Medioppia subpectinata]
MAHKLGTGSFGDVSRARHKLINRDYAIKMVKVKKPDDIDKYMRELNLCIDNLRNLITMKTKKYPRKQFFNINKWDYLISYYLFLETAECVHYLHTHQPPIIHRDLKPSNILFTFTHAPEVYRLSRYTTAVDIYSLGVICEEIFNFDSLGDELMEDKSFKLKHFILQLTTTMPSDRPNIKETLDMFHELAINDNILVKHELCSGKIIKLGDFGLDNTKLEPVDSQSVVQSISGDWDRFMAPEVKQGSTWDTKADVYSVAIKRNANDFEEKSVNNAIIKMESELDFSVFQNGKFKRVFRLDNIVTIPEFENELNDRLPYLYIQMDLCWLSLSTLIKQMLTYFNSEPKHLYNPLGYYMASELMVEIVTAVKILHTGKPPIIHRDINLNNVLIFPHTKHPGKYVKLSDFGLAVYNDPQAMSHTQNKGTERYMAPEVRGGRSLGMVGQDLFNFDNNTIGRLNPDDMYKTIEHVIGNCLKGTANERPTCEQILAISDQWATSFTDVRHLITGVTECTYNDCDNFIQYFLSEKCKL